MGSISIEREDILEHLLMVEDNYGGWKKVLDLEVLLIQLQLDVSKFMLLGKQTYPRFILFHLPNNLPICPVPIFNINEQFPISPSYSSMSWIVQSLLSLNLPIWTFLTLKAYEKRSPITLYFLWWAKTWTITRVLHLDA